jgi:hypothetical protein
MAQCACPPGWVVHVTSGFFAALRVLERDSSCVPCSAREACCVLRRCLNRENEMRPTIAFGSMVVLLGACNSDRGGGVGNPTNAVAAIALAVPSTDPLTSAGDTRSVIATALDAKGSPLPIPPIVWRTSAPSVAVLTASGNVATVTAVDDGTAVITAISGEVEGEIEITVRRRVVGIEVSTADSVVVAGFSTQLTVVGRDARQNRITGLTGISFSSSNPFSVSVSPTGLATALFSSFRPFNSTITATVTADGATLTATKRIDVGSAEPLAFDGSALLEPEGVRPEPVNSAGEGIVFLTRDGAQVHYKILWSLLSGPPVSAHIHGIDDDDTVADVLVDLPLGAQASRNGTATGTFSATDVHPQAGQPAISLDSLFALIGPAGFVYADVHTAPLPDGEIRGSIVRRR